MKNYIFDKNTAKPYNTIKSYFYKVVYMAEPIRESYTKMLSQNLLFLMSVMGKKRKQVCKDLNIPYTTYTDWVNGNTYPKLESMQLLADYFCIDVNDLHIDISQNFKLVERLEAYANGIQKGKLNMPENFQHKSLSERINEYDGNIEIYTYDWNDMLEGGFFDE